LIYESLPVLASIISTFSRAGLNVVDRRQYKQDKACPLVIGYWNNFLPVCLMAPFIFFTPALDGCLEDLLTIDLVFMSILIQCVAYSFSFTFKHLRVTDVAVLSKAADVTVPIALAFLGFYSISYIFFLFLSAILVLFFFSTGFDVFRRAYKSAVILVLMLTSQGVYAYFFGLSASHDRGFWSLLSAAFSVLVWRFIFSGVFLIYGRSLSWVYFFPSGMLSHSGFYFRGFLTLSTQVTFIFAITANNLMIVWPILNATGFLGAVFAYLFLKEKLSPKDFLFISFSFLISGLIVIFFSYENHW
jgi:hypothetical protein